MERNYNAKRYQYYRTVGRCVACGEKADKSRCPACMKKLQKSVVKSRKNRIERMQSRINELEALLACEL